MRCKIFLIAVLLFVVVGLAYAGVPVYCPYCKTHLYDYKKDSIIPRGQMRAKDFIALEGIEQPQENTPMVCPLDGMPLNGWEYWGVIQKNKAHKLVYKVVSLLSKNNEGKFIWLPYDVPELNMNEEK